VGNAYLYLPGRHLEFFGELFAPGSIRFLVGDKDSLEYLKLRGGCALACLDGVRNVGVKHLRVDFGGIHAGWNKRGYVRAVTSWGGWGVGGGSGIRRVAQQHNPLGGGREEREREKKRRSEFVEHSRGREIRGPKCGNWTAPS
jgi:hypothetical protein